MTIDQRSRVYGDQANPIVALAFGSAGIAAAALTVLLVVSSADAASAVDPSRAVGAAPAAPITPAPVIATAAEPAACPPLVVSFAFASAALDGAESAEVDRLAAWLVKFPDASVLVHGHADAFGKDDTNLAFSRSRALAVSTRLVAAGVGRARITARGFGAYQPVEGAPEEAASNRRAVVYVKGAGRCPSSAAGEVR
jgi:outer membrane protein OmpA-like peptidoglycan-associated protein